MVPLLLVFFLLPAVLVGAEESHDICIVGAGAGGLQVAQLLENSGRDYVVFEREAAAGSFYAKFPIHRKLISLNKRNTGRDNTSEFNWRHDWNSLLGSEVPRMTTRTKDRWPSADTLVEYLHDFAQPLVDRGTLHLSTEVLAIGKSSSADQFTMTVRTVDKEKAIRCRAVVMAHGLGQPNIPAITGLEEHTVGYEQLHEAHGLPGTERHEEFWEKKNVAILGLGNAALEVSDAASPFANFVHIYTHSGMAPKVSWESHYVGSIRGIRASHLDGYLLKSLDLIDVPADHKIDPNNILISPCGLGPQPDKKCIFKLTDGGAIVQLGTYRESDEIHRKLLKAITDDAEANPGLCNPKKLGGSASVLVSHETGGLYTQDGRYKGEQQMWVVQRATFERLMDGGAGELSPLFTHVYMTAWRGNTARKPYDIIVRCLGWKQDRSMFDIDNGVDPTMDPTMMGKKKGKYGAMTPEFESVNTPGLFWAGALAHGLDWRKSSGGFIHGFRYTARALTRVLEMRIYQEPWPHKTFPIAAVDTATVQLLAKTFTDRIAQAAGPYQMFSMLADGMLLCREGQDTKAIWMEEVPSALFDQRWAAYPRLLWAFRYARPFTALADVAELGTSFGPFVWAWHCPSNKLGDKACKAPRDFQQTLFEKYAAATAQGKPFANAMYDDVTVGIGQHSQYDDRFYFPEDPHTEFNQYDDVEAFEKFIHSTLSNMLRRAKKMPFPKCEAVWDPKKWGALQGPVDPPMAKTAPPANAEAGSHAADTPKKKKKKSSRVRKEDL